MERLIKTIRVLVLSSVLVFAMSVGTSYASISIGGDNEETGPNSENENEWDIDVDFDLDIRNEADVDVDYEFEVQTGRNEVSYNTEVGDTETGSIWGEIEVENELNSQEIEIDDMEWPGDIDVEFENGTTGPNSENENSIEIEADLDIDILNSAEIDNSLDLDANTGYNEVEYNTVAGDIETGDIKFDLEFESMVNGGGVDLGDLGNLDINADFSNEVTGPYSSNENELEIDHNLDVNITNTAEIDNSLDIDANTGHNEVGNNTVVGNISTGSVMIQAKVKNIAN